MAARTAANRHTRQVDAAVEQLVVLFPACPARMLKRSFTDSKISVPVITDQAQQQNAKNLTHQYEGVFLKSIASGIHVRNDHAFQALNVVFQLQLAFFHAPQTQLVDIGILHHQFNRMIEVAMLDP